MENGLPSYERPPRSSNSVIGGVCMMSSAWKDEQHPSFSKFISAFLTANYFRLNVVRIAPDFIFNCGGTSTAFLFVTNWDCDNHSQIFTRVQKLKGQFAHFYVVLTLPTKDQNDSFVRAYFKYGLELGKPTFVPVQNLEMGFEKIVNITHTRGVSKRQDVISNLKAEKKSMVQSMDAFVRVVTSIPGITAHDANMLNHAVGSIEAIAKASREYLLENTDLSQEKVDTITRFFRDRKFYLSTHIQ